jgi:DNA-binding Xre family transcriptional regulator
MPVKIKLKLAQLLEQEHISAYKLREQSELSTTTVYERLLTGHEGIQLSTLATAITALEVLLERRVKLEEVMELEWFD